jgi:tRNA-uridine 2-sulfurtransferase
MRVVVAMSGGVDSSVAAALLKEAGHEVIGVTMQLWPRQAAGNSGAPGCCGSEAINDARKVAARLGIRHYVLNFRDIFARHVIADFAREYSLGRTPNPCVVCNNEIKFGVLWEKAAALGADRIATGHHARIERDEASGEYRLKKGADARKDQSYFLCRLTLEQLARAEFPVGRLTKPEVRRLAAEMGLPTAARPESQDICFIPGGDHAAFVREYLGHTDLPGPILDEAGNVLGEHRGIASYTIGQRHGLGVAAAGPLYVTAIRPGGNAVVVGGREMTFTDGLVADDINWINGPPAFPIELMARIRYRHPEAPALVTPFDDGAVYVKFADPQMAVAPGQTIAFYDGDTVLGGGTILRQGSQP